MVVIVFASLTLLSLPALVAQYTIRHDEFSSDQHLQRFW